MRFDWLREVRRALGLGAVRPAVARARPRVEHLEDRWVPASFVVTSLTDVVDANDGLITLREAVEQANLSSGPDDITFAPGLSGTLLLTGGQMAISEAVTITGNGSASTVIDAQQMSRIFVVTATTGDVTLAQLTLKNGKTTDPGGIFGGGVGEGGAVRFLSSGTLTVSQSTLSGNSTTGYRAGGGAIFADFGTVSVSQSTLSGNSTAGDRAVGGAISALGALLSVSQSTLSGNFTAGQAAYGGAILAVGAVSVSQSTLSGNSTTGNYAYGGAIFANTGAVSVSQSTLSGNSTAGSFGFGGAIFASTSAVSVSQSTLSGNSTAGGGADGGAIFARSGAVSVSQSTVTGNRATNSAGGGIFSVASPLRITNSIVAGNTDNGTASDLRPGNALVVQSSLIGTNVGTLLTASATPDPTTGNIIGGAGAAAIDPMLAPLANNGGPTQTHALLSGSPALDRASTALAVDITQAGTPALTTDQRGTPFARPFGGAVDIGAFELQMLPAVPVPVPVPTPALTPTTSAPPTRFALGTATGGLLTVIDRGHPLALNALPFGRIPGALAVAVGDVNGDLAPDLAAVVSVGPFSFVTVFDGATSELRLAFPMFPSTSIALGDLDGDGTDEIILGFPTVSGVGVFDGLTGAFRGGFFAYPEVLVGVRVAAGDLDGDGKDEIIAAPSGPLSLIRVYTGAGALVRQFLGVDRPVAGVGATVAAGDLDGDGLAEILVGANTFGGDVTRVFRVDGSFRSELLLTSRRVPTPKPLLSPQLTVADLNGDGAADLLYTAGTVVGAFTGPGLNSLDAAVLFPDEIGGAYLG